MISESTESPDACIKTLGGCVERVFGSGMLFMGLLGAFGLICGNRIPTYQFIFGLIIVTAFVAVAILLLFGHDEVRIFGKSRKIEFLSSIGRWRHSKKIDVPFGGCIICMSYDNPSRYGYPVIWRLKVRSIDSPDAVEVVDSLSKETAFEIASQCRILIGEDVTLEIQSTTEGA